MDADEIIRLLSLTPHPREGGYFAETYRSTERLAADALPARYGGERSLLTAIYYLLTPATFSALHRLRSDELFHFYLGDPVEMLTLWPDGRGEVAVLGADLRAGMRPQVAVPAGVWQGARLASGGRVALLGTTVAPGFDYDDFELAEPEPLAAAYPEFRERVRSLSLAAASTKRV